MSNIFETIRVPKSMGVTEIGVEIKSSFIKFKQNPTITNTFLH